MPGLKVHLEVGKRLNTVLNYKDKDEEQFIFGNVLPDLNTGFVVEGISEIRTHKYTHYNEENITYINFYKKNKNKFNEPLVIGYFTHLYTDYLFNNNFYTSIENKEINKLPKKDLRILKQEDFKLYGNKYINNNIEIKNKKELLDKIKLIDRVSLNNDDINRTILFLKNKDKENLEYHYYNEEALDELLNYVVETILSSMEEEYGINVSN